MHNIIEKIKLSGLTPNQYVLLYSLKHDLPLSFDIEDDVEYLQGHGYLDVTRALTNKCDIIFTDPELEDKALTANTWRFTQVFPPMILPSGSHSRGHLNVVKPRLKTFIELYQYDWDTIFEAAENYVNRFKAKGYKYMRNCPNFIMNKDGESLLSLECDIVQHGKNIDEFSQTI